jgi:hypothetical protein
MKSREDDSRYLYLLQKTGDKKKEDKDGIQTFKRYQLADEKVDPLPPSTSFPLLIMTSRNSTLSSFLKKKTCFSCLSTFRKLLSPFPPNFTEEFS